MKVDFEKHLLKLPVLHFLDFWSCYAKKLKSGWLDCIGINFKNKMDISLLTSSAKSKIELTDYK